MTRPKPKPKLTKVTVVLHEPDEAVIVRFAFSGNISSIVAETRMPVAAARALVRAMATGKKDQPMFELRCDLQREGIMEWLEDQLKHPSLWIQGGA